MNSFFKSFVMAFSTFSISPKTHTKPDKENTKFILLFVPIIGIIIAVLTYGWTQAWPYLCDFRILPAAIYVLTPMILSGSVHLEGFVKTTDALRAHKSREKKMEILADPQSGYFAVIICICYYLLDMGIWSEMPLNGIPILAIGFVMSRCLFGLSILALKHAKESKCAIYVPENKALRAIQIVLLTVLAMVCSYFMVFFDAGVGIACVTGAIITFIFCWLVTYKHFDGITEDCAGFFVQLCEIIIPLAALLAYKKWW